MLLKFHLIEICIAISLDRNAESGRYLAGGGTVFLFVFIGLLDFQLEKFTGSAAVGVLLARDGRGAGA